MERKTISIMKACELVGVSRRTIYNWLASGKIEYVRTAGRCVLRDAERETRVATCSNPCRGIGGDLAHEVFAHRQPEVDIAEVIGIAATE